MAGKPEVLINEKKSRRRIPKWVLKTATSANSDEQYYSRSIGRALDVLDCFDGKSALAMKDIGGCTRLPEPTLFRVLLTLVKHGYLDQAVDGTYQIALKLRLGWGFERGKALRQLVRPELEHLNRQFEETASLAYLVEDRIHVLDSVECSHGIRVSNQIGRVLPPHCSAMGKTITAFQDRECADRIIEAHGLSRPTEHTITDRTCLMKELEEIRRTGIGYDREESVLGAVCYSAAIRHAGKAVIAALSLSAPVLRMDLNREQEVRQAVLLASARLSRTVGAVD